MLKLLNTSWNSPFLTWPALYTTSPHLAAILNVPLAPVSLPARIIWGFPSLPQVSLLVPGLPKHHGLGLGVEWSWRGGGSRIEYILKEVTPLALGEFQIIWKNNIEGLNEKEVFFGYVCLLSIVCVSLSFGQPTMQAYFSIQSRRVQRNCWRGREHFFWTHDLVLWYYVVRFWQMTSYDDVTTQNVESILTSSVTQQQQQQQSLLCSLPSILNIWRLGGFTALQHLPEK